MNFDQRVICVVHTKSMNLLLHLAQTQSSVDKFPIVKELVAEQAHHDCRCEDSFHIDVPGSKILKRSAKHYDTKFIGWRFISNFSN